MADGDDLDRRLRQALGTVSAGGPAPGARQAVLSGLRRRRDRRRRLLGGTALAALAVAAVAVGLSTGGSPVHTAAPPAHRPATSTTPAPPAPSTGTAAGPGCAVVRAGGASATCAGVYSTPSAGTFGAARPPTASPTAAVDAPEGAVASGAAAAPEELSVGETLTVDLPAAGAFAWGVPRVEQSTAAGAGRRPVLEVVRSSAGGSGGRARLSVRALRPGVAELVVGAGRACRGRKGRCAAAALVWTLHVAVEGT